MKNRWNAAALPVLLTLVWPIGAAADLNLGSLGDFEDGTVQGWGALNPGKTNSSAQAGGPPGSTFFLQLTPLPQLAAANSTFAGIIDVAVTDVTVDLMRPSGQTDLEMRLVLHGPGIDRWTSNDSQTLPGDGVWRNYSFSILEADLTQVLGSGSYADLEANFGVLQVRHQAGPPSAGGTSSVAGTFAMDNVLAVPEPHALAGVAVAGLALGVLGRRRRA